MGPLPAPLLPNWDVFAIDNVIRDIGYTELPANWLQCQENSLDPVHSEWLHGHWGKFIAVMQGHPEKQRQRYQNERIGLDEFEYGIIKRRPIKGGSYDDPEWAQGHPVVFPYFLRQGGSGFDRASWEDRNAYGITGGVGPSFQIRVPLDDTHTGHWWVMCHPKQAGEPDQRDEEVPFFQPPLVELDGIGRPRWGLLDSNSSQDIAAWTTQGPIADRTEESLGRSDKGVIMFRRMLEQNIRIVEDGGDPINTFRDPEWNMLLAMEAERGSARAEQAKARGGFNAFERQGMASKFSPILTARGASGGVDAGERRLDVGQEV